MTRADMDEVQRPVRCGRRAWGSTPGSTWSSCTPRTAICCRASSRRSQNKRTDEYGGSLENRLRYPLEVFAAMREAWPADRPMSVRISANDWMGEAGVTPDEAVQIAEAFAEAGADLIDVSAGQTWVDCQAGLWPAVPDAVLRQDPQRGQAGDHGGRQHHRSRPGQRDPDRRPRRSRRARPGRISIDPMWTLRAAAQANYRDQWVPPQYLGGMAQMARLFEREAEMKAAELKA